VTSELLHAVLRPARGGNAFEQTVERLAEAIKLGVFQAGDRLPPERELADVMQVSRMTLREALAALRDAGFVETRRGRAGGTYVRAIALHDGGADAGPGIGATGSGGVLSRGGLLRDALDFRRVVEPGAAALAAERASEGLLTKAEITHLRDMLAAVEAAPDDGRRRIADSRLHLAVAFVAGSESLTAAVAEAQVRLGQLLAAIPVLRRNIEHSDTQHRTLVDAIVAGDPGAARAAMEEHCDATSALLRGLLG
jgi:DNA-binding FadR family transcriptional regulator